MCSEFSYPDQEVILIILGDIADRFKLSSAKFFSSILNMLRRWEIKVYRCCLGLASLTVRAEDAHAHCQTVNSCPRMGEERLTSSAGILFLRRSPLLASQQSETVADIKTSSYVNVEGVRKQVSHDRLVLLTGIAVFFINADALLIR